ncbi:MAG: Fe-S protein assembly co-chaperone HscB [Myxococcales bacterium]|nr:Fe-S protein assembly co-chaperone HscB [Myxococcales bacterium]
MTERQEHTSPSAADRETRDYFAVLGLPRKLRIDAAALKRTFHALNRAHHPDLFHGAASDERARVLARSTLINDAYTCLKDRVRRVEHLLALEGRVLDSRTDSIPPRFFDLVMDVNMAAQQIRAGADGAARAEFARVGAEVAREAERSLASLEAVEADWDAALDAGAADRAALVDRLDAAFKEVLYLRRLQTTIRAATEAGEGLHG